MASLQSVPFSSSLDLSKDFSIFGSVLKSGVNELTLFRFSTNLSKNNPVLRLQASKLSPGLTKEAESVRENMSVEISNDRDPFSDIKQRFLTFKKEKFLGNKEHYESLAENQSPKFMVIACADSRVCPSNILGFQPGEAFIVRNIANLVLPYESGPSTRSGPPETKAALEFCVNVLQVENILVIGHSRCGGIRALMSMQDEEEESRSFIKNWVTFGKNAKVRTKSVASKLDLDQQCQHCEKESLNHSLMNLLTYPWIKEKFAKGLLSIHGGYYDFVNGTFEKWTLDYNHKVDDSHMCPVKCREFWS